MASTAVVEKAGVLGLDDLLPRGALGRALEVWVLDGDVEPELVLLELPPDAAHAGHPAPVGDDAATGAADFEGLGLTDMTLNYLGEAAESHARDGPAESSAWQLRDDTGRGEGFVECLCRIDRLGQRDQAVNQCAIANLGADWQHGTKVTIGKNLRAWARYAGMQVNKVPRSRAPIRRLG
jgi:hypothetical protein